ncbi:MAG: CinA family protein [Lachnospiraceae bacterium]|nr:CinA family protein [Lachnospiraceae bacterium]
MSAVEERVVEFLKEKKWMIATAESCTGGLIGAALVNVPGASSVYSEGFITYSDQAKHELLGVKEETLARFTAVSAETAREMAEGAANRAQAQVAVASTGIAGPDGGTPEQPVGLVYLACFQNGQTRVERHVFEGDRAAVRHQAMDRALEMILEADS